MEILCEVMVATGGGERIDDGERRWSRIDGGDSSFGDSCGYDCNDAEIQEI